MNTAPILATVALDRLPIPCIVGILPRERLDEQEILLDVRLELDVTEAVEREEIDATVDYAALADDLTEFVISEKFLLIETMAARCARRILEGHPRVRKASITVNKPQAVPRAAGTWVRVELEQA